MRTRESMTQKTSPRRIKGWMDLTVSAIRQETPDCITAFLKSTDSNDCPFDYTAGQYLTFRFDALAEKPVVRSYTMSSSPVDQTCAAVTVKQIPGGIVSSHFCNQLKVGDTLKALGPIGKFIWDDAKDQDHLVMVAAGSGVTPFLSIIREYIEKTEKAPKRMALLVSFRTEEDIICSKELLHWSKSHRLDLSIYLSREKTTHYQYGRIDKQAIQQFVQPYLNLPTTYMTCGPEKLMQNFIQTLADLGVEKKNIKQEAF